MTDEEAQTKYDKMVEFFSNRVLPDLWHEPVQFAYYVKLFNYYTTSQDNRNDS